jgi:hypothetical protein
VPDELNYRKDNRIRDITDGAAYRKNYAKSCERLSVGLHGGSLGTLILNTDGLQTNESGRQSAWPVFGMLAEIPPQRRCMNDKIFNLALWQGEGKPPIELILQNLQMEMDEINERGNSAALLLSCPLHQI